MAVTWLATLSLVAFAAGSSAHSGLPDLARLPAVLTNGQADALFDHHDSDCEVTCNGETLKLQGDSKAPYECWGKFEHACEWEGEEHAGKTTLICHGAFAGGRNSSESKDHAFGLPSSPLGDEHSGTQAWARCEGAATAFVKVAAKHEAAAQFAGYDLAAVAAAQPPVARRSLRAGDTTDDGPVAMMFGYRCLGEMTYLHLPHNNGTKTYTACTMDNMRGVGRKRFADTQRSLADVVATLDSPEEAGFLAATMQRDPPARSVTLRFADLASGTSAEDRQVAAVSGEAGCQQGAGGGAPPVRFKACSRTCNGNKPAWGGWWPCRGSLDIKCKGSHDDVCWDLDMTCSGISLPAARTCKGLWTEKLRVAKGDKEPMASQVVDTGITMNREVSKNGWMGSITFGRGLHFMHGSK